MKLYCPVSVSWIAGQRQAQAVVICWLPLVKTVELLWKWRHTKLLIGQHEWNEPPLPAPLEPIDTPVDWRDIDRDHRFVSLGAYRQLRATRKAQADAYEDWELRRDELAVDLESQIQPLMGYLIYWMVFSMIAMMVELLLPLFDTMQAEDPSWWCSTMAQVHLAFWTWLHVLPLMTPPMFRQCENYETPTHCVYSRMVEPLILRFRALVIPNPWSHGRVRFRFFGAVFEHACGLELPFMISCYVPESIKWVVLLYVTYLVPLVRCCLILSQPNASIEDVIRWIKRWVVHVLLSFARVHVLVAWFPPTSFDPIVRKVVEWLEVVFPGVSSMSLPGWLRECYGWLAWCVKAIDLPDVDSSLRMAAPHGITDRFCFCSCRAGHGSLYLAFGSSFGMRWCLRQPCQNLRFGTYPSHL